MLECFHLWSEYVLPASQDACDREVDFVFDSVVLCAQVEEWNHSWATE